MLNELTLNKPWAQFQETLQQWVTEANQLNNTTPKTNAELQDFQEYVQNWDDKVIDWLKQSFNISNNQFVNEFYNVGGNYFRIPGHTPNVSQEIQRAKETLNYKIHYLVFNEKILGVCDAIVRPSEIDLAERSNMKIKQKLDFILKKLYELYDDSYYPLGEILKGNAIHLRRESEADDLADTLESQGYLDCMRTIGSETGVRLTAEGALLVEESMEPVREDYDDIRFTETELAQKLEEIKAELVKSGLGHEILYDELQEMKALYTTLNKKTWGQLLKGKLIDVALSKVVETATLTFVYKELTDHVLKLF